MNDLDKPLFTLTVREFLDILTLEIIKIEQKNELKSKIEPIRGIHGLAKALGISPVTAQNLKNSGKIPYSQYGRVILFDYYKVLEAIKTVK